MSPPLSTCVPAAVDALVTIARGIPDCAVLDGPTPRGPAAGATIAVGVGDPAVSSVVEVLEGLTISYLETSLIVCNVWSWSGGTELKPHRDRCAQIVEQLDTAIRADVTLGGICDQVTFGPDWQWTPEVDTAGASYTVAFTIRVKALSR